MTSDSAAQTAATAQTSSPADMQAIAPFSRSALVAGGSILGRAHGSLLAMTSSPTPGGSGQIRSQKNPRSVPLIPEMPIILAAARELSRDATLGPNGDMPAPIAEIAGIGESVEISASDGVPCRPSQMAQIAGMSRAAKRESGALIRAGVASGAHREKSDHRCGDSVHEAGAVRNNCASIACMSGGRTSRSDGESSVTDRIHSAMKRESGALIRASHARSACGKRSGHRDKAALDFAPDDGNSLHAVVLR